MKRITRKKGLLVAVAAVVIVMGAIGLTGRAMAGAPSVDTAAVTRQTLSVKVSVAGKTEADVKADVFAPVAGTLSRVLVAEGQRVRKGQVLAKMDDARLDAQVERAEAAYDSAAAQLDALDSGGPSAAERNAVSEQVSLARGAYEGAARDHVRALAEHRVATSAARATTRATVAAARTRKEQAYGAYLSAKAQRARLASSGPTDGQRHAAEAGRDQAAAEVRLAKADRDKAVLRSPTSGVVVFCAIGAPAPDGSAAKASAGAAVGGQVAVFSVVRMDALRFSAEADEADVARVHVGDKATVTLDAFPGREFYTRVKAVAPTAVPTKNGGTSFPAVLSLAGARVPLKIGMNGTASISVSDVPDALVVPADALMEDSEGEYVFVVKDGMLSRRSVTVGAMTDTQAQLTRGVRAGEIVALTSNEQLRDGSKVRMVKTRTGGAAR